MRQSIFGPLLARLTCALALGLTMISLPPYPAVARFMPSNSLPPSRGPAFARTGAAEYGTVSATAVEGHQLRIDKAGAL